MSTQTLRNLYPELVVGGVDKYWNAYGTRPVCNYAPCVGVQFLAFDNDTITLRVHPTTGEAFRAIAAVFKAHNYAFREMSGGTVACRKITGGTRTSPHAHGIALDMNPSKNGYRKDYGYIQWGRHTDMTPAMIADIEAIRTNNGKKVFEWGGRWWNIKDPMHFQVRCAPADLKTGIDWTTVQAEEEDQMITGGLAAAYCQQWLIDRGYDLGNFTPHAPDPATGFVFDPGADGDPGTMTSEAVKKFQTSMGMAATGLLDGTTVTLLKPSGGAHVHNDLAKKHGHPYAPSVHGHDYSAKNHGHGYVTQPQLQQHTENPDAHHD